MKHKTAGFAVRRKIIEELLKDPEYKKRWDAAKDTWDFAEICIDFCIEKGYKVASI